MFEKIFTYSSLEKKENKISGVGSVVRVILFLFPVAGLLMGIVSAYVCYISVSVYKLLYYAVAILFVIMMFISIKKWMTELFTVFAIGKDKKLYRFKMIAFAMNYLGFGSKMSEIAAKGRNKTLSLFELMYEIKNTIENLNGEDQITEMFSNGYLCRLDNVTVIKNNTESIVISADFDNTRIKMNRKITIRKVYEDSDNLFHYCRYLSDGENGEFEYIKKTSAEQLMPKKAGYIEKVFRQSVFLINILLWVSLFMYSGVLHSIAKGMSVKLDLQPVLVLFAFFESIILVINIQIKPKKNSENF